ncbi:MAG: hypothetical protein CMQ46_05790 [Gammaproteobacteria bacterium]|nr:hypothetical protein [Gammaproteobacteria bacterium]
MITAAGYFLLLVILSLRAVTLSRQHRFSLASFAFFTIVYFTIRPIWLSFSSEFDSAYLYLNRLEYVPLEALHEVLFFVSACWLLIEIGYRFSTGTIKVKENLRRVNRRSRFSLGVLFLVFVSLGLITNIHPLFRLLYLLGLFLVIYLCSFIFRYGFRFKGAIVNFVFLLSVLVLLFGSDDRRDFAVALAAFFLMFLTFRESFKIPIKSLLYFTVGVVAFLLFAIGMRQGSYNTSYLSGGNLESVVAVELDFPIVFDTVHHVFYKHTIDDAHWGVYYLKPFFWLIPRSIFPDKPETLSRVISREFNPGFYSAGGSEPITIYGEFFFNFYWFGVLLFFLVGYSLGLLDDYYLRSSEWFQRSLAVTLISSLFFVFRGPIDTVLIYYFVLIIVYYILSKKSRLPYFSIDGQSHG